MDVVTSVTPGRRKHCSLEEISMSPLSPRSAPEVTLLITLALDALLEDVIFAPYVLGRLLAVAADPAAAKSLTVALTIPEPLDEVDSKPMLEPKYAVSSSPRSTPPLPPTIHSLHPTY